VVSHREHHAGQRPGRAGHANAQAGGRGGERHRRSVGGKARAGAFRWREAFAVVIDEHPGGKLRQLVDHGGIRGCAQGGARGTAAQRRAGEKRSRAKFERVAEEGPAGGLVCWGWHGESRRICSQIDQNDYRGELRPTGARDLSSRGLAKEDFKKRIARPGRTGKQACLFHCPPGPSGALGQRAPPPNRR
jgi:hypothetical protein